MRYIPCPTCEDHYELPDDYTDSLAVMPEHGYPNQSLAGAASPDLCPGSGAQVIVLPLVDHDEMLADHMKQLFETGFPDYRTISHALLYAVEYLLDQGEESIYPEQLIRAALEKGLIENYAHDYAEPGYSLKEGQPGILFANWNERSEWIEKEHRHVTVDRTMPRLLAIAEKLNYEVDWSDQWTMCDGCSRVVRTDADSYGWQRAYAYIEGEGEYCIDCIQKDYAAEYLESLEGQPNRCITRNMVDPEKYDYKKVNQESYEHGWYGGQDADPQVIAKTLDDAGVTRFVFYLDSVGQFDAAFSLYVHEDQFEQAVEAFEEGGRYRAAKDPARVLDEYLRSASYAKPAATAKDGITIIRPDENNQAVITVVSPKDFVEGKAFGDPGVLIGWRDSTGELSARHRTVDGEYTICRYNFKMFSSTAEYSFTRPPRRKFGRTNYCRKCFGDGVRKSLDWHPLCLEGKE